MSSEDVLVSVTSRHLTAGLSEADLAGISDPAGFGTVEIQAETISGSWPADLARTSMERVLPGFRTLLDRMSGSAACG